MYIEPNSTIKVMSRIPLDADYEHSLYFATKGAQSEYFIGYNGRGGTHVEYTFNDYSYQRTGANKIRVNQSYENLINCNYLAFINRNFENRWFYAFITSITYINNEVTEIEYKIDPLQTWFFDFNFGRCFIERRHTEYDEWSANCPEIYTEEIVNNFEYVSNSTYEHDMSFPNFSVCILTTKKLIDGTVNPGQIINHIYVPMGIKTVQLTGNANAVDDIEAILADLQEDEVIAIYEYPSVFGAADSASQAHYTHVYSVSVNTTSVNGYTPKNKKLLGYPFNILQVSNNSGQTSTFKIEMFSNPSNIQFMMSGVFVGTPCALFTPLAYRGKNYDFDNAMTYANFPMCAWGGDTYKAWMAQNKSALAWGNAQNIVNEGPSAMATGQVTASTSAMQAVLMGIPAVTGMAAGAVPTKDAKQRVARAQAGMGLGIGLAAWASHFFGHILGNKSTKEQVAHTTSRTFGQVLTESINTAVGRTGFSCYNMQIKAEEAMIADDYFSKFGYSCNRVMLPNLHARSEWTFIKTKGCILRDEDMPMEAADAIKKIMDNGITFWANPANVGRYDLANTPLSYVV